jgi:flagellar biogenesis protein FliO
MFNRSSPATPQRDQLTRPSNWFAVLVSAGIILAVIVAALYLLFHGANELADKLRDIR